MWPNALLIPLTHCLAPLSNTEEHVPCSLQRHTVNILSLYPRLCCRDLLLYTLISLLNHKSFCKALGRSKKTSLCLKQDQILSRTVMPHTYSTIIPQATSAGISDKYRKERLGCCLPIGQMCSEAALLHRDAKGGSCRPCTPNNLGEGAAPDPHQLSAPAHTHSAGPAATTVTYFALSLAGSFPLKQC